MDFKYGVRMALPAKKQKFRIVETSRPEVPAFIADIEPYSGVSSFGKILKNPEITHYKLDWNESTITPSPKVKKTLMSFLDNYNLLNYYPALFSPNLTLKLQSYVGYPADHILVTNGSDDALELICKTFLEPGDEVAYPDPTYTHFLVFAQSRGASVEPIIFEDPFAPEVDEIISAITPKTKIVYLPNPNNPTGALLSNDDLRKLATAASGKILIVDEAYYEFAGQSALEILSEFENVVVTRSFSKAFGLAAVRVGYLIAQPWFVNELKRLHNPKSVNQFAQVAASAALDDLPYYNRYVEEVRESKALFERWCKHRSISFRNTPANYVLINTERVEEVVAHLSGKGIHVRDRSNMRDMAGYIRFNLGTIEQTRQIMLRFEGVLKELGLLKDEE